MFLIAGESLIDLVHQSDGSYRPFPGGAPYNFARALALQGVASCYLNAFSGDAFGILLGETLARSGAGHRGMTSDKPTSLALVSTDAQGHPRYSFYRDSVADRALGIPDIVRMAGQPPLGFHTGALALVPPDNLVAMGALEYFRDQGIPCTVDINLRPPVARSQGVDLQHYRDAALAAARLAHVVKLSDEDLLGLGITQSSDDFADSLLHQGCRLVLLTLGASGAWVYSAHSRHFQPAETLRVVDTVGAGDAFFAGFIAALHRAGLWSGILLTLPGPDALVQALRHASACAAINIEREGCQPPTWEEASQRYN